MRALTSAAACGSNFCSVRPVAGFTVAMVMGSPHVLQRPRRSVGWLAVQGADGRGGVSRGGRELGEVLLDRAAVGHAGVTVQGEARQGGRDVGEADGLWHL